MHKKMSEKYTDALIDNNYYSVLTLFQEQSVAQLHKVAQQIVKGCVSSHPGIYFIQEEK